MSVLINFKICDNDKACNGRSVCPKEVFEWDDVKKTLIIHNEKCISCGLCEEACMVSAIRVAHSDEEYKKIEEEYEKDPRSIDDLLVDRYGAAPINPAFIGTEDEIEVKRYGARPMVIELYTEESIMCLLKSIPIKEIIHEFDKESTFRKVEVKNEDTLNKYGLKEVPALLFFKDGQLKGRFEGYIEDENQKELINKIKKFI